MNKLTMLLAGAALVSMASCGNDEPNNVNKKPFEGTTAYMTINISDVTGRSTTDEGFVYGDADEHAVDNARFYFFDADGVFVTKASVWKGGQDGTEPNVEYIGKNVIVLDNLTGENLPKYMMTVLNLTEAEEKAVLGTTMMQTAENLTNWASTSGKFVMCTTSFTGGDASSYSNQYYYTNVLKVTDFRAEPLPTDMTQVTPVNIYVERLAAKVQLVVNDEMEHVTFTDGTVGYKLHVTVAGNPNDEGNDDFSAGLSYVYVKFTNWSLNATAANSHLAKDLGGYNQTQPDFLTTAPFANWNDVINFRSYWGKSTVYGLTGDAAKAKLNPYVNYGNLNIAVGKAAYCNENTNTVECITREAEVVNNLGVVEKKMAVVPSLVTHVAVGATVCDQNGNALDLIRDDQNGTVFLTKSYLAYVLNVLQTRGQLNFYTLVGETDGVKSYKQITVDQIAVTPANNNKNGAIYISADIAGDIYALGADGSYEVAADGLAELNALLAQFTGTAFTNGAMYYAIPVEHLMATPGQETIVEGYYGVVRNHWYKLTINKLNRLGHGIYNPGDGEDPGEPIIPDDPEDPSYYLGARINILSWKLINQNVEL